MQGFYVMRRGLDEIDFYYFSNCNLVLVLQLFALIL